MLAGGRYDGLVSMMGGADCPAVGWACGLDRMALLCPEKSLPPPDVGVLSVHDSLDSTAQNQARLLREEGFSVYLPEKASFSKQMKKIHQQNCVFALILGADEWKAHEVSLKEMNTGKQIKNLKKLSCLLPETNSTALKKKTRIPYSHSAGLNSAGLKAEFHLNFRKQLNSHFFVNTAHFEFILTISSLAWSERPCF